MPTMMQVMRKIMCIPLRCWSCRPCMSNHELLHYLCLHQHHRNSIETSMFLCLYSTLLYLSSDCFHLFTLNPFQLLRLILIYIRPCQVHLDYLVFIVSTLLFHVSFSTISHRSDLLVLEASSQTLTWYLTPFHLFLTATQSLTVLGISLVLRN